MESSDSTQAIDEHWMQLALEQARLAENQGEVPVGAVLVDEDQQLLAQAHNQPVGCHDPTAHAEILVLRAAGQRRNNYRLVGCTLYVTIEPCAMCVGAMVHARISRLVFGAHEPKAGAIESSTNLLKQHNFNHQMQVTAGIFAESCASIMSNFFARRRQQKKGKPRT